MSSKSSARRTETATATAADRRRTPRLHVHGVVSAVLVNEKARADLKDLSFGGFAADTSVELTQGAYVDVAFEPPIGEDIVLNARVAYTKKVSGPGDPPRYHGGFEFVHRTPLSRPAVGRLMTRVAAVLGFGR